MSAPSGRWGHSFKRHKYGVSPQEKRTRDGMLFDSQAEAKRYDELKLMKKAGEVVFFLRQVPFHLPGMVYRVDFAIFWANGTVSFEDVKGVRTSEYKAKKRAVETLYPVSIEES